MSTGDSVKKTEDFNADDRIKLKLLDNSIYFLTGEIDPYTIDDCIKWIIYENLEPREKTLTIYINSPGGDPYSAFALIDIMKNSKYPIRTIGIGAVMSAAFLIFASGTNGERIATRNASFMSHQFSETITGKYHDLKATMRAGDTFNQRMLNILKDATNLPLSKIKSKLLPSSDVYLTAEELLDLGVADHIL
jgi:ATP-dependent Clp protease, protease subunit